MTEPIFPDFMNFGSVM